ncbi:MAG: hypothetical protein KME38_24080 [Spirirestis rafaelensis WJT71-NPBG6]|nr:hypothetical protein [Spirirestis rafaelensis WJT71-NPBG6]
MTTNTVRREELEQMRDQIVAKWRLSKRAESKERIAQALNEFIKELSAQST